MKKKEMKMRDARGGGKGRNVRVTALNQNGQL